jgi:DNA-binding NtrC family response regulator
VIKIPNLEDMPRKNGDFSSLVLQSQAIAPAEVSRREIRKVDSKTPMSGGRILVVEDDDCLRRVTQAQLEKCGHQTAIAGDVPDALAVLEKQPVELVITDLNLPGMSGLELLSKVRNEYPDTSVVIITAYGTIETAVAAIKAGAYDYITKPVHPDELKALVSRVIERHRLIDEVRLLRSTLDEKYGFEHIVGRSGSLVQVLDSASRVAQTDATVLILGETGTGKELIARAIHLNSLRRDQPFVIINCGAIPTELLESELFGHVKGSFTGATNHKKGKVEMAEGGTIFLDEIGEMQMDLQVRLLRLLQEREIEKIGSTSMIRVDVRVLAATHRNLEALVAEGKFREDLYYRLAVIPITVPPLRERPGDVAELVDHFFSLTKTRYGRTELQLPSSLMPYLLNYRWPGNVRELENLMERLVLLSRADEVTLADLPERLRQTVSREESPNSEPPAGRTIFKTVERDLIVQALRQCNWNKSRAARQLEISRKTLLYRMRKYGIVRSAA